MKRLISLVLACIIALSVCVVPAFAEDNHTTVGNFWQAIVHSIGHNADILSNSDNIIANIIGQMYHELGAVISQSSYCAYSDDHFHHSSDVKPISVVLGDDGLYYAQYKCDYCGYEFYTEHSEAELSAAYDSYVDDLPVNGIDSTGSFVWYPVTSDLSHVSVMPFYNRNYIGADSLPAEGTTKQNIEYYYSDNTDGVGIDCYIPAFYTRCAPAGYFTFNIPVNGTYALTASLAWDGEYTDESGNKYAIFGDWAEGSSSFKRVGETIEVGASGTSGLGNSYRLRVFHGKLYYPVFSVVPDVSALVGYDYSADTRPSAIIMVNDTTIINEDNSTFYNPVTEETYDMREWSYDYSDRSYHVTTNEGDTVTVTYGDENITINQGDTVYNVNYTIPETPVEPHEHNYVVSDSHDATCTVNGSVVYTCSECGLTYSETVPPLGHDWEFVETVAAVEDEEGNVVEEAYDLYRCRRCGEERQVPVGSAPASDGENATGFFSWLRKWLIAFKEWLGDKLDKLMGGGGVTNDLDIDDGGDGEEETDPADDPAHSHDDDDGAGWLLWFIRKLTKAGSRAVRGLAGVVFEETLDGVNDSIQGMKDTYGDSGGSVASGGFDIYDSESVWQ